MTSEKESIIENRAKKNPLEESQNLMIDFSKLRKIQKNVQTDVIPVVVQDVNTKEVLIVAYVNELALKKTIETKMATFWSTSRNELWTKGLTSGDILDVVEIRINCDQNSLLYLVRPRAGGACHTKDIKGDSRKTCYYRRIKLADPKKLEFLEEYI